jgi:hypothetical protein
LSAWFRRNSSTEGPELEPTAGRTGIGEQGSQRSGTRLAWFPDPPE